MNIDVKIRYDSGTVIKDLEKDTKTISQLLEKMAQNTKKEETEFDKFTAKMGKLSSDLFSAKQIKGFLDNVIRVRTEFENAEFSLKGLLGSTQQVSNFMDKMKDYSFGNTFSFKELTDQSVQLLKFHNEVDNIIPIIDKLSKVAVGANESLNTFVGLYNQSKDKNLVEENDIEKWASYGVDIIQELSRMFNKTETEIRNMVDTGRIGFSELDQVLTGITSSGGKYADVMSDRMDTLGQDIRLLGESMNQMYNEIGKNHEDLIRGGIDSAQWLIANYEKIGGVIASIIAAYGSYKAALIGVTIAQRAQNIAGHVSAVVSLAGAVKNAKEAQVLLNLAMGANPILKLATVLIAVGGAIWTFTKNTKEAAKEVGELEGALNEEGRRVNDLILQLTNANTQEEARKRILNELNSINPLIVEGLNAEAIAYEQLKKNLAAYNDELIKRKVIAAKEDVVVEKVNQALDIKQQKVVNENETRKVLLDLQENLGSLDIEYFPKNGITKLDWKPIKDSQRESLQEQLKDILVSEGTYTEKATKVIDLFPKSTSGIAPGWREKYRGSGLGFLSVLNEKAKRSSELDNQILQSQEAVERAKDELKELGTVIDGILNISSPEKPDFGDFDKQYQNVLDELANVTKKIQDLDSNRDKTTIDFDADYIKLNKQKKDIEEKLKRFEIYKNGESNKDRSGNKDNLSTVDYKTKLEQEARERKRSEEDLEFSVRQARINAKEQGTAKILEQNQLDYDLEIKQLARQQEDRLSKLNAWEKTIWESQGKTGELTLSENLPDNEKEMFDFFEEQALEKYKDVNNRVLNEILAQYQTYAERRQQINEKYNKDLSILNDFGNEEQTEEARALLEAKREEELSAIDSEIAAKEASFTVWAEQVTNLGLKQLKEALATARATLDNEGSNLSENEKAVLRAKIKSLEKQLQTAEAKDASLTSSEKSLKKWKDTSKVMTEVQGSISNIISSFDGLDDITKTALNSASNIAGGVIAMITQIQTLAIAGTEAVKGVERASVILAVIGAAVQIMTTLFSLTSKADKEHQTALKEIEQVKISIQREYNKLLREQALLMKEAESAFGVQQILKAAKSVEVYRDTLEELRQEMKGLKEPELPQMSWMDAVTGGENSVSYQNKMTRYYEDLKKYEEGILALSKITVKTDSYTTGKWFWKKQHDVYTSVLDVYKDLLNTEGELNIERAKSIIATEQMSDENKELLQTLINLQEEADNALEELRNYLQDTFGSLGDGLVDSLVSAIQNDGVDAWEKFGEVGASVLEDLGKQLVYSLYFADKFKKLQAQLEDIYGSGMTEEEIGDAALKTIGSFYNTIGGEIDKAQGFMETWKKKAEEAGFEIWGTNADREASSKGIASISQDSADEMNGRMTAIQSHTYTIVNSLIPAQEEMNSLLTQIQVSNYSISENIRLNFELLTVYSQSALQHLAGIESNTFRLGKIEADMGVVKSELQVINMKGIIIRTP